MTRNILLSILTLGVAGCLVLSVLAILTVAFFIAGG